MHIIIFYFFLFFIAIDDQVTAPSNGLTTNFERSYVLELISKKRTFSLVDVERIVGQSCCEETNPYIHICQDILAITPNFNTNRSVMMAFPLEEELSKVPSEGLSISASKGYKKRYLT